MIYQRNSAQNLWPSGEKEGVNNGEEQAEMRYFTQNSICTPIYLGSQLQMRSFNSVSEQKWAK